MQRIKMPHVSPGQMTVFDIKPDSLSELPDPWTLPADGVVEFIALPHKPAQPEQKPLPLLPPAREISTQPPLVTTPKQGLEELLAGVELDNLPLRPARKIAKLLNISQKANGKDKPLALLRDQIKAKLAAVPESSCSSSSNDGSAGFLAS